MPQSLKAVVTISAWVLFIKGWLAILAGTYTIAMAMMAGEAAPLVGVAECGVGLVAFVLTAVAVKLRLMLE